MLSHPVERLRLPTVITCSISLTLLQTNDERSFTNTPVSECSLISKHFLGSLDTKSLQIKKKPKKNRDKTNNKIR